jgi:hypothetical protein
MLGYRASILLFFISSLLLVAHPAEPAFVASHRDAQNTEESALLISGTTMSRH